MVCFGVASNARHDGGPRTASAFPDWLRHDLDIEDALFDIEHQHGPRRTDGREQQVDDGGRATLTYSTPVSQILLHLVQLAVLVARIRDKERSERAAKEAATRKSLVGSGDRSDRIRTYSFPQGRLTDHRINLTLYKLGQIMDGDLGDVVAALKTARAAEQLEQLEAGGR